MDLAAIRSAMAPLLSGIAGLFTVDNLSNPYFYAYLPAAFVMCRVMTSSLPDLRGSGMGATAAGVIMVPANMVAFFFGDDPWGLLNAIFAVSSSILCVVGSAIAANMLFLGILCAYRLGTSIGAQV